MLPKHHILYGAIFGLVLIPFIGLLNSFIVFLASFLIDADHYLRYVYVAKDISIKNSISYFYDKSKKRFHELYIFHTVEFWVFILILGFYYPVFIYVLLGMLYHMVFDFIDMFNKKYYNIRIYSVLLWMILKI